MNRYYKIYSRKIGETSWTLEETFSDLVAGRGFAKRKTPDIEVLITEVETIERDLELIR